jgi:hypothetical protein
VSRAPRSAPLQAQIAALTLPNSTVVDIPGVGHGAVTKSRCAQHVFASFLTSASAPNIGCVARLRPPTLR